MLLDTRRALRELVLSSGMKVFSEMLEEDRTTLCGPRHHPSPDRRAYRHGHDEGSLVFGGRKIRLGKPRVRSVEGDEVELPTWRRMTAEDPLRDRVVKQVLRRVSSRGYEGSLEPLPEEIPTRGTRRSSVCRHFLARTAEQTKAYAAEGERPAMSASRSVRRARRQARPNTGSALISASTLSSSRTDRSNASSRSSAAVPFQSI